MTTSFTLTEQELDAINTYGGLIRTKQIELQALNLAQEAVFDAACKAHGAPPRSTDVEYDVNLRSGLVQKKEAPKEEPKAKKKK